MAKINKNNSELLEQAKWGKLSSDEIDYVAQQIAQNADNLYTLIHILGRANANQYRQLIEPFLFYSDDPEISEITLKSLCTYWDLSDEYLSELKTFIKGVDWDDFDDVRMAAISISGEYLKSSPNVELLNLLIDVFENLGKSSLIKNSDTPELIRSCAYQAIARALGKEHDQIPNTTKIMEQLQQNKLDLSLIDQAKHRQK